ncbi:hypothetical protein WG66_011382, partial [Moniliophthora roreri]
MSFISLLILSFPEALRVQFICPCSHVSQSLLMCIGHTHLPLSISGE